MSRTLLVSLLLLPLLLLAPAAHGQVGNTYSQPWNGAPTGSCSIIDLGFDVTNGNFYTCSCQGSTCSWVKTAGPGGASTGNTKLASNYAGADCGAKIVAARADLGNTTPGEIWVDQACGTTISTAVTIGAQQVLRFVQGGTYTVSAQITDGGHIIGPTSSYGWEVAGKGTAILKEANTSNLAPLINVNVDAASVEGVEVDGNKANNASAGDCIDIVDATGVVIENVFVHDCKVDGVNINSTSGNKAAVPMVRHVVSYNNGRDGLRCNATTDVVIGVFSEFELNAGNGIRLIDCPGMRMVHSDVAQNTLEGLFITGTDAGQHSDLTQVVGNQFGGGFKEDIYINGWGTTGYITRGNNIVGNVFYGGTNRSNLGFPAVRIKDSALNSVAVATFNDSASHLYTYAIQEDNTAGHIGPNTYAGNNFFFAGGETGTIGNIVASNSFYAVDSNGTAAVSELGVFKSASLANSGQIFLGCYPDGTGCVQFSFNTGITIAGVAGDHLSIARSGTAFIANLDQSGNLGVAGSINNPGLIVNSSGLPTKVDGITTAGQGVGIVQCITSAKTETGADTNVLTCTPASAVGSYEVCVAIDVSAANTATLGWTMTWTNSKGNANAPTNMSLFQMGVAAPALTFTAAANNSYYACVAIATNNAGTAMVVKTTFSGTSIAYNVTATIKRII